MEKFGKFLEELGKDEYELDGFLRLFVKDVKTLKRILIKIIDSFEEVEFAYKNDEKEIDLEVSNKHFIKNFIKGMTKKYFGKKVLTAITSSNLYVNTHGNDIVISNRTSDENVEKIIEIWKNEQNA